MEELIEQLEGVYHLLQQLKCSLLGEQGSLDAQNDAANEVCWTVILMMQLGLLEIPLEERPMLADPMAKWSDLAFSRNKIFAPIV
jgi:hypothetical protein